MELIILPDAQAEMIDAANSYEARLPELGNDFLDEVSACFERIVRNPQIGQTAYGKFRRVLTKRFPYAVVYEVLDSAVLVVAVAISAGGQATGGAASRD